jgi:hypothetical protein
MSSGFATGTDKGKEAERFRIRCSNTWQGGKYGSKSTLIGLVMVDGGMMGRKMGAAGSMDAATGWLEPLELDAMGAAFAQLSHPARLEFLSFAGGKARSNALARWLLPFKC